MSKVCKFLFILFLFNFGLFFFFPQTVSAASCEFNFNPDTPNQNMGDLSVTVTSKDLPSGRYAARVNRPNGNNMADFQGINLVFDQEKQETRATFVLKKGLPDWVVGGDYKIFFGEDKGYLPTENTAICKGSFTIAEISAQTNCLADIEQTTIDTETGVTLTFEKIEKGDNYAIYVDGPLPKEWPNNTLSRGFRVDLGKFWAGSYTVTIKKSGRIQCNQPRFTVNPLGTTQPPPAPGEQGMCDIYASALPGSKEKYILGAGLKELPPNQDFQVKLTKDNQEIKSTSARSNVNGLLVTNVSNDITKGSYTVKIFDTNDSLMCTKDFSIPQDILQIQSDKNKCGTKDAAGNPITSYPYKDDKGKDQTVDCVLAGKDSACDESGNRGPAIKTAIGCIHTSPPELVKDFMTFIIGISGGLAFLMMLLGAFQMLTSAGNPETLHAGRERLTSAVIGLLIVIFAILLLQIIGVGILNIPGFKP